MAARRKADQLIASGQVMVNGTPAVPGQQVTPGVDRVTLDGSPVEPVSTSTYLMLNKPVGVLTSVGDDRGRQTVVDHLPPGPPRVFPVGRLDLDSRGLVLLTDDGELAGRLMHPRYHVEKEYRVVVRGRPDDAALRRLSEGMIVRGERFEPAEVRVLDGADGDTRLSTNGKCAGCGKRLAIRCSICSACASMGFSLVSLPKATSVHSGRTR
ncbi:MAG: rRNA pseudouridine synthase [Chloroflexi bacterium]|nr:MAG: rRNA pseudouridine synthase [Chloroflexota bacterium]